MLVEIWSDIVCPFCYIGKRRFETAMSQFTHRDQVQVVWRSFELDTDASRQDPGTIAQLLAAKYGRDIEWAKQMNANMTTQASELGLRYDFDKVVPTNSFDAHRLIYLAKKEGLQDQMAEALFSAYFTEGQDISDRETLTQIATRVGLDEKSVRTCLETQGFASDVRSDEAEARSLGITGVPAFVIDRRYLISGAQAPEVFLQALTEAWGPVLK